MAIYHGERMIEGNGIEFCTDSFGDPSDPAILLVIGRGRFDAALGCQLVRSLGRR